MAGQAEKARFEVKREGQTLVVAFAGDWLLGRRPRFAEFQKAVENEREVSEVRFDTERLGQWDSAILVFLQKIHDHAKEHDWSFQEETLPEDLRSILKLATAVPEKRDAQQNAPRGGVVRRFGHGYLDIWNGFLEMVEFLGQAIMSFVGFLTGRSRMRWKDFFLVLQSVGAEALPIVALISFLVGLIIAFLGAVVLLRFGAEFAVSYLVGYGMLREMGAVMTGVIMAGRTGAAFAAQIGSMKVTEEIDALKTLGLSPVDFIVLPRMLTLILMMPLLTIYADIIGIFGGYMVAQFMLDVPTNQFFDGMVSVVGVTDFYLGVFKGLVFGIIVAYTGCLRGMQCGNSADAVGVAATRAVVTGITFIIFANAIIDWMAAIFNI